MRIKINLLQLTPKRSPDIYWLHVDLTCIMLIKQLKEKIKRVLRESRDIELYLDNVPFLDEDDIYAINENEEIIIKVKDGNKCTVPNDFNAKTDDSNVSIIPDDISSYKNLNFVPVHFNKTPSSILPLKKRTRKRTHNKKHKQKVEPVEIIENNPLDIQCDTSIGSIKGAKKMHKRFKVDNENDDSGSEASSDHFEVSRQVLYNGYSSLEPKVKETTVQTKKKGSAYKSTNVPVFVRGKMCTAENSTPNGSFAENDNNKAISSADEDCDMLVVDWKNLCPVKLLNISELQYHDLIQFKTLYMNERGEPEMSSVITARINQINYETSHLTIQILSGIEEFLKMSLMCNADDEDTGTEFEVQFDTLLEIFRLL